MVCFMKATNYLDIKTGKPQYSPIGWYVSEKFDGQRAHWCPETRTLQSRYGNTILAPDWFLNCFKTIKIPLDGELFMGYGQWHLTGIFRGKKAANLRDDLWKKARFMVFDIPDPSLGTYLDRMKIMERVLSNCTDVIKIVQRKEITSKSELESYYNEILSRGGEGVMLNNPSAFYHEGRTDAILKLKPVMDDECVIVGYKEGNGRNAGRLGSFIVHPIEDGVPNPSKEFSMSGVSDMIRASYKKTHPIGTVLSYACNDFTKTGKPRHPRYLGKCNKEVLRSLPPVDLSVNIKDQSKIVKPKIKARFKIKATH